MKILRWIFLLCALLLAVSACAPISTQGPDDSDEDDTLWDIPVPKDIYPLSVDHLKESELPVVCISFGTKKVRDYGSVDYTYCGDCIHIFQYYQNSTLDIREYFFCPYEGTYRGYMREYSDVGEKSWFEEWREFDSKSEVEAFLLSHIDGDFPSYGALLGVDADAVYQGTYEHFVQVGRKPDNGYTMDGNLYSLKTKDGRTLLLLAEYETGILYGVVSVQAGVRDGLSDDWEVWSEDQIYQYLKRASEVRVEEAREMTVNYLKDWDLWVEQLSRP